MRAFVWRLQPVKLLAIVLLILTIPISATDAAERRLCLIDLHILGTGGGFVCEQGDARAVIDTSCDAFVPFRYSRNDTEETKQQAREHNAAWDALCKRNGKEAN